MARYTGPRAKINRKFGEPILGITKSEKKKGYAPGQHGNKRRKKTTLFGEQLAAKQKAKYTYGILERQFRNIFKKASAQKGVTGENLLQLLECRLDNAVYRLGIAPTRRAARQLVSHRHIEVNAKRVNIPSYTLAPDDVISVRKKSQKMEAIIQSIGRNHPVLEWLAWDKNKMTGKLIEIPSREAIPENIKDQSIVEIYSK